MIEVNLLGAITATEVFLDQLRDGGGDLINISSVAGRTARPGNAGYAATKWGLNGWSEALRQELQPDVRVIVIEPGAVATELTDHITHAETKAGAEQMYKQTSITAQDIAEVIAFAVLKTAERVAQRNPDPPDRPSPVMRAARPSRPRPDRRRRRVLLRGCARETSGSGMSSASNPSPLSPVNRTRRSRGIKL